MRVLIPSASSRLHIPADATVAAVARAHCPILPAGINSATVADSAVVPTANAICGVGRGHMTPANQMLGFCCKRDASIWYGDS